MASSDGLVSMARPASKADLRNKLYFFKKRKEDEDIESKRVTSRHHAEPLEVNVVDTSIGTGGGSCGEGADKSSPSTSGGVGGATTATASPRSLAAMTSSPSLSPSHSPRVFHELDAIVTSNEEEEAKEKQRFSTYETSDTTPMQPRREDVVVMRRRPSHQHNQNGGYQPRRAIYSSNNEAGRLLKSALESHFNRQQPVKENPALDDYIREVFHQLDYHRSGTISREDFETLCEVLELGVDPTSRPISTTFRHSGLEWLSSYRPRSPLSPLRVDKLSEVKYRGPSGTSRRPSNEPPPNFLFTLGPRPFWELWPQRKRKKRRLTIDEFKRALLEQWARSQGLPPSRVSQLFAPISPTTNNSSSSVTATANHRNHRHVRSVRVQPIPVITDLPDSRTTPPSPISRKQNGGPRVHYETKTRRFMRSVMRATKRFHVINRLSRRLSNGSGGPPRQPRLVPRTNEQPDVILHVDTTDRINLNANNGVQHSVDKQRQRVKHLEKQVEHQQTEISGLRDVVEDLRSSLQLSDAQNLALQVLLKKMAKAEIQLPVVQDSFRSQMDESEKHLENLVRELKEMSQTKYPTYLLHSNTHGGSSTATSINGGGTLNTMQDFALDDEVHETSKALGGAQEELRAAQQELQTTVIRLQHKEIEVEENSMNLRDAYRALERAQQELNKMRIQLEEAQTALETTKSELNETREELMVTQTQLNNSDLQLKDTEKRLSQLSQNRRSLVLELQTTREVLVSSLKKVQDLELESQKVPVLENRIRELERNLQYKKSDLSHKTGHQQQHHHHHLHHHVPPHLRPLSTVDSGLYSTSDSDHDDQCPHKPHDRSLEGVSDDDDVASAEGANRESIPSSSSGLPPRPPSSRSRDKSPRAFGTNETISCLTKSPSSSGHHSASSKFSVSSPSASPSSSAGKSPSPSSQSAMDQSSSKGEEAIAKLRREIGSLKERFANKQKDWSDERNSLLEELLRKHEDYGDITTDLQVLEAERVRLSLLEEKIKEVLTMLRSLNSMDISPKTLGKLVLDAVERSVDPLDGEIQVFKFLNHLYHSARDYERMSTENMIHKALQAVEAHSQTLADIEARTLKKSENSTNDDSLSSQPS